LRHKSTPAGGKIKAEQQSTPSPFKIERLDPQLRLRLFRDKPPLALGVRHHPDAQCGRFAGGEYNDMNHGNGNNYGYRELGASPRATP
jgi:hypothetical protein